MNESVFQAARCCDSGGTHELCGLGLETLTGSRHTLVAQLITDSDVHQLERHGRHALGHAQTGWTSTTSSQWHRDSDWSPHLSDVV